MASNKVKFGLKNVYYAVATESGGVVSYGTPVSWPGGVSLSLSPVGEVTPFVADDIEYILSVGNNGYDGSLEVALIPDAFKVSCLGESLDTKNVQFETSTAEPVSFALMFEVNGDSTQTKHVLYKCTASRPNIEGSATTNKEIKTETLAFSARYYDGAYVHAQTRPETTTATVNGWTTAVKTFNSTLATPIATPAAGEVDSGDTVVLTCANPDAKIYYTIDDSTPDATKTEYTAAIAITVGVTIKAIAILTGYTSSSVLTSVYTVAA